MFFRATPFPGYGRNSGGYISGNVGGTGRVNILDAFRNMLRSDAENEAVPLVGKDRVVMKHIIVERLRHPSVFHKNPQLESYMTGLSFFLLGW